MPSSEYIDCELFLSDFHQAKLTVHDQSEATSVGRDYLGRPELHPEKLARWLLELERDCKEYGIRLFEALFPEGDDLLAGYRWAEAIARHEGKGLRFRLHIATTASPKIHDYHWERLYDPKKSVGLSRCQGIALSRYLARDVSPPPPLEEKPRLLVVISAPKNLREYNLAEIDPGSTRQELENALKPLQGLVSYEILEGPATLSRISDHLISGRYHALHLHAHGILRPGWTTAKVVLEDEATRAAFVDEELFSEVFTGERDLRLITLIACHSGTQPGDDPFSGLGPALLRRDIPAVIAMRRAVSVNTALSFTRKLYQNLARCGLIDEAVNKARLQLYLDKPQDFEWSTAALFMRLYDGRFCKPNPPSTPGPLYPASEVPWGAILPRIKDGKLVPIIGNDVIRGLLPSNEEIATRWADEYGYPLTGVNRNNLARVAKYVEAKEGRCVPHDILPKLLKAELLEREGVKERAYLSELSLTQMTERIAHRHFDRDDAEPHRILAELPISTYITTNYDAFMTAALTWTNKKPQREYCRWQRGLEDRREFARYKKLKGTEREPLVFHLYGNDEASNLQVLTEDDYLDFLGEISGDHEYFIPFQLRGLLANSILLFLGYRVGYLDCRVLFRGLVRKLKDNGRGRIALLQPPPERMFMTGGREHRRRQGHSIELDHFIQRCCSGSDLNIEIYWRSDRDFLTELRDRWRAEHGGP